MKLKKVQIAVFTLVLLFVIVVPVTAHPSSQQGIIMESYITGNSYNDWYVGSEIFGWSIDENYHTNGAVLTYSFSSTDPFMGTQYPYRGYALAGANLWNGTVSIQNKSTGGTGTISTYMGPGGTYARFLNYHANPSTGHLTSWDIQMNRNNVNSLNAKVMAHEFGHAIGLNDLFSSSNKNKLMYGYITGTATAPTIQDKRGAKVITGQHVSHTFGNYGFWDHVGSGNRHSKICSSCKGSTPPEFCVYGSGNLCTVCGYPRNAR